MSSAPAIKSFDCEDCELIFSTKQAYFEHRKEEHPKCTQCKVRFLSLTERQSHQQDTSHCYCRECDSYFPNVKAQLNHVRKITHNDSHQCCDCNREYTNQDTLSHHCCYCDVAARTLKLLKRHLSTKKHLRQAKGHDAEIARKLETAQKLEKARDPSRKCKECDKTFTGKRSFRSHMSSCHNRIQCPVGKKCKKFATPSALLNHLESGCCSSGMTRNKLHQLVFAHDPDHHITSADAAGAILSSEPATTSQFTHLPVSVGPSSEYLSRNESPPLLPLSDEDNLSEWSVINNEPLTLTPSNSNWSVIGGGALASPRSNNGSEWSFMSQDFVNISSAMSPSNNKFDLDSQKARPYRKVRCPLCPPGRIPFKNVNAYEAHINSTAHAPKIFHCPLSLTPNVKPNDLLKNKHFSSLGGLAQHLESGRCEGGLELYQKAISFVEEQLSRLGLGDLLLLPN